MNEKKLKDYDSGGRWHEKHTIKFSKSNLYLAGVISGCGLAQCYGLATLQGNLTKEEFLEALKSAKNEGIGAVIGTLGDNYYDHEEKILKLGFERISEYHNYRHGNTAMQRIYILKL